MEEQTGPCPEAHNKDKPRENKWEESDGTEIEKSIHSWCCPQHWEDATMEQLAVSLPGCGKHFWGRGMGLEEGREGSGLRDGMGIVAASAAKS